MTHTASHIIIQSLLDVFDEDQYEDVREHFTSAQLAKIDSLRERPAENAFTSKEKEFISRMVHKAIFCS